MGRRNRGSGGSMNVNRGLRASGGPKRCRKIMQENNRLTSEKRTTNYKMRKCDFSAHATLCYMGTALPPPQKGSGSPIFGPCLLWQNSWMDQNGTWHGGRPQAQATLC